jgi:RHS repeat-associated protein
MGVSPYVYNAYNELTSKPGMEYSYDGNGNLLSKLNSGGTTSYVWDPENRLTSITLPGSGGTVSFQYDPFGRRIYKSSPLGTTIFVYDGYSVIEEVNADGSLIACYTQSLGIDEPVAMLRGNTMSYYQADGLGSVTSLSDSKGNLVSTYEYDSFGNLLASTGSIPNPFRFTGREFDAETHLYFYRARYYDPSIGRFISEDPIQFGGGINFYRYAFNNPINFIDPWGLIWVTAGHDYHGVKNWGRWYLNRWGSQIGKGMDPTFPGADPEELVGLERDVLQEWRPDPDNPCKDSEFPIGTKRRVLQKYNKFLNPGPDEVLVNNPDDPYYYQWDPWVSSPTYESYPNTK